MLLLHYSEAVKPVAVLRYMVDQQVLVVVLSLVSIIEECEHGKVSVFFLQLFFREEGGVPALLARRRFRISLNVHLGVLQPSEIPSSLLHAA